MSHCIFPKHSSGLAKYPGFPVRCFQITILYGSPCSSFISSLSNVTSSNLESPTENETVTVSCDSESCFFFFGASSGRLSFWNKCTSRTAWLSVIEVSKSCFITKKWYRATTEIKARTTSATNTFCFKHRATFLRMLVWLLKGSNRKQSLAWKKFCKKHLENCSYPRRNHYITKQWRIQGGAVWSKCPPKHLWRLIEWSHFWCLSK